MGRGSLKYWEEGASASPSTLSSPTEPPWNSPHKEVNRSRISTQHPATLGTPPQVDYQGATPAVSALAVRHPDHTTRRKVADMPNQTTDPLFDETDLDNPNYYCAHGTFVGNPYGADYMCGWCEDGTPWEEYTAHCARQRNRNIRRAAYNHFTDNLGPALKAAPKYSDVTGVSTGTWHQALGVVIAMGRWA